MLISFIRYHPYSATAIAFVRSQPLILVLTAGDEKVIHRVQFISRTMTNLYVLRTGLTMVRRGSSQTHGTCLFSQAPQYILTARVTHVKDVGMTWVTLGKKAQDRDVWRMFVCGLYPDRGERQ